MLTRLPIGPALVGTCILTLLTVATAGHLAQDPPEPEPASSERSISSPGISGPGGSALVNDDLGGRVLEVFRVHCVECHGPDLPRPKGRFGEVLDLAAMAENPGLVVPGDPDASELYLLLVDEDPEYRMPPPDFEGGPLDGTQIASVRAWIEAGCPPASGGAAAPAAMSQDPGPGPIDESDPGDPSPAEGGGPGERDTASTGVGPPPSKLDPSSVAVGGNDSTPTVPARTGIARFHPLVLHFPIALVLSSAFLALLAWVSKGPGIRSARNICLTLGALGAIATSVTGWFFAPLSGYPPKGAFDPDSSIFLHRWGGIAGTLLSVLAALAFTRASKGDQKPGFMAHLLLFGAATAIGFAGHEGGLLLHGFDPLAWPRAWIESW